MGEVDDPWVEVLKAFHPNGPLWQRLVVGVVVGPSSPAWTKTGRPTSWGLPPQWSKCRWQLATCVMWPTSVPAAANDPPAMSLTTWSIGWATWQKKASTPSRFGPRRLRMCTPSGRSTHPWSPARLPRSKSPSLPKRSSPAGSSPGHGCRGWSQSTRAPSSGTPTPPSTGDGRHTDGRRTARCTSPVTTDGVAWGTCCTSA